MFQLVARYVLAGVVLLGVIIGAVSWFQMSPESRAGVFSMAGRLIGVGLIVLLLPWATFFVTTAVAKRESNLAGVALVAGYTVADVAAAAWLLGSGWGSGALVAGAIGLLIAIAYNVLACDLIADRLGN